jgi:hypothetical protein
VSVPQLRIALLCTDGDGVIDEAYKAVIDSGGMYLQNNQAMAARGRWSCIAYGVSFLHRIIRAAAANT